MLIWQCQLQQLVLLPACSKPSRQRPTASAEAPHDGWSHVVLACVFSQSPRLVQAEQAEEYSRTVARLGTILEERRGKYAFADLQVSLQADQHDKVGLPSAVVAYR